MKVYTTLNPENVSNIYLITDDNFKSGIIIDPGSFALNVYKLIKATKVEIKKIIVTHDSIEKTAGIPLIKRIYDAEIYALHKKILDYDTIKVKNDFIIKEGDLEFKIIETPVNTFDAISILIEDNLFVGNILQSGSLNGFEEKEFPSEYEFEIIRKRILSLPNHLIIYPGKGPTTTMEIEKNFNPYFKQILENKTKYEFNRK
jgi:glyoxylase-like metal-dependent hydrolase (beta-lactamase superfamily II)